MNKDALLATLIGFGIGLVITGAFLFGPSFFSSIPKISFSLPSFSFPKTHPKPSPTPDNQQQEHAEVTITAPLPDLISRNDEILVSGTAPTGTTIIIGGLRDEAVITTNGTGTFAGQVKLDEGKNDILVTGYINGKPTTKSLTIYYTPENL